MRKVSGRKPDSLAVSALDVAHQVALLGELGPADGAAEPGLDAALVVLVPPKGREEGVALVALVAHVLPLGAAAAQGELLLALLRLLGPGPSLAPLAALALVDAVAQEEGPAPEVPAALRAGVLLAGPAAAAEDVEGRGRGAVVGAQAPLLAKVLGVGGQEVEGVAPPCEQTSREESLVSGGGAGDLGLDACRATRTCRQVMPVGASDSPPIPRPNPNPPTSLTLTLSLASPMDLGSLRAQQLSASRRPSSLEDSYLPLYLYRSYTHSWVRSSAWGGLTT
jgi:hypothetical protein